MLSQETLGIRFTDCLFSSPSSPHRRRHLLHIHLADCRFHDTPRSIQLTHWKLFASPLARTGSPPALHLDPANVPSPQTTTPPSTTRWTPTHLIYPSLYTDIHLEPPSPSAFYLPSQTNAIHDTSGSRGLYSKTRSQASRTWWRRCIHRNGCRTNILLRLC